jgi:MioC protein
MTRNINYLVTSLTDFLLKKLVTRNKLKQQYKVHDYTQKYYNESYCFDSMDGDSWGYMTAQQHGVSKGDRILIVKDSRILQYEVEEIDYYANPSDMWIALLRFVSTNDES